MIVANYFTLLLCGIWPFTKHLAHASTYLGQDIVFVKSKKKDLRKSGQNHTKLLQDEDSVSCSTIPPRFHDLRECKFIVTNKFTLISALNIFPSEEKIRKAPSKQAEG